MMEKRRMYSSIACRGCASRFLIGRQRRGARRRQRQKIRDGSRSGGWALKVRHMATVPDPFELHRALHLLQETRHLLVHV
mmetsp:Transcript_50078/g.140424  ORF Transcript_50078/g.140424 Transcript_50078/m.140424 type:complete len:80 (+) Transcript_50078:98-337(+)